jgi:hypothetical protein
MRPSTGSGRSPPPWSCSWYVARGSARAVRLRPRPSLPVDLSAAACQAAVEVNQPVRHSWHTITATQTSARQIPARCQSGAPAAWLRLALRNCRHQHRDTARGPMQVHLSRAGSLAFATRMAAFGTAAPATLALACASLSAEAFNKRTTWLRPPRSDCARPTARPRQCAGTAPGPRRHGQQGSTGTHWQHDHALPVAA